MQSVGFPALCIFLQLENIREQDFRNPFHCTPLRVRDHVGIGVERRSKIRMAQQRLRGLDRLSYFREQRRMGVPERVPRNTWLFDPITRRREHTVVDFSD